MKYLYFIQGFFHVSQVLASMEEHASTPAMDLHATVSEVGGEIHVRKVSLGTTHLVHCTMQVFAQVYLSSLLVISIQIL